MLVLSREEGESVVIRDPEGREIIVSIEKVSGDVRIGFDGPESLEVIRSEIQKPDARRGRWVSAPSGRQLCSECGGKGGDCYLCDGRGHVEMEGTE